MPWNAAAKAYQCRPEVAARRRQQERDRKERSAPQRAAYRRTVLGRLLQCRRTAWRRLERAESDVRRQRIECLIARYNAEIDRIRHRLANRHEGAGRAVAAIIAILTHPPA